MIVDFCMIVTAFITGVVMNILWNAKALDRIRAELKAERKTRQQWQKAYKDLTK